MKRILPTPQHLQTLLYLLMLHIPHLIVHQACLLRAPRYLLPTIWAARSFYHPEPLHHYHFPCILLFFQALLQGACALTSGNQKREVSLGLIAIYSLTVRSQHIARFPEVAN